MVSSRKFGLICVDWWRLALKDGIFFLAGYVVLDVGSVDNVFSIVVAFWRENIVD